jgi:hypothetical protein
LSKREPLSFLVKNKFINNKNKKPKKYLLKFTINSRKLIDKPLNPRGAMGILKMLVRSVVIVERFNLREVLTKYGE